MAAAMLTFWLSIIVKLGSMVRPAMKSGTKADNAANVKC